MTIEDCYYLGAIVRTHGLKGDLLLKLDTDQPEAYKNLESMLLDINQSLVPFFIKDRQLHSSDLLKIKIEDCLSADDAQKFIGRNVYLPLNTLPKLEGNKFYYHEVIGFNLTHGKNIIGEIIEINDNINPSLFIIKAQDKEIYIPIINSWIIEVNRNEKYILMELPDGILDV